VAHITPGLEVAILLLVYMSLALGIASAAGYAAGVRWLLRLGPPASVALFAAAAVLTFYEAFTSPDGRVVLHEGALIHDRFTSVIVASAAAAAALGYAASYRAADLWPTSPGFQAMLPVVLFGVYYLSGSVDPALVIASWLLLSIASYVVIALPGDRDSSAAATRYIYVGTVATLLLALWVAGLIGRSTRDPVWPSMVLAAGLASLGFKVGVFPFHWWLPSVYGRADGRAVAVVAGIAKLAFIALLTRLAITLGQAPQVNPLYLQVEPAMVAQVLAIAAVATMTVGNVAALTTSSLQAMLAYSSVAQAGYILVGLSAAVYLVSAGESPYLALAGIALQSMAYALAKTALFALAGETGGALRGSLRGDPAAAAGVAVLLASLLGIPILVGFWGKLFMFLPAASYSPLLVAIALANSGVSSAYYIRFLREAVSPGEARISGGLRASIIAAAALTIAAGLAAPLIAASIGQ